MNNSKTLGLLFVGFLFVFSSIPIMQPSSVSASLRQLPVPVDLVANWNFAVTESGGWEGNDHNATKPAFWYFAGDTNGPKEHYRLINDTENDGDADTLFLQPTRTNQEHTVMLWQDFTTLDISQVTIQYRSCAAGPTALIVLYGLNASTAADTPLPNGTLTPLTMLHPHLNETPGYWPTYTTRTISLSNITNSYHHYRIHWQLIETPGKPDAQLYIASCRVTGFQLPLPPMWIPPVFPLIAFVTGIIISIIMLLFYLKEHGKFQFLQRPR
jgi:hypothetical protein